MAYVPSAKAVPSLSQQQQQQQQQQQYHHHRKGRSSSSFLPWWSHLFSLFLGILLGSTFSHHLHFDDCFISSNDNDSSSSSSVTTKVLPLATIPKSVSNNNNYYYAQTKNGKRRRRTMRYDLLPILIQDTKMSKKDIRMVITEAIVRVNFVDNNYSSKTNDSSSSSSFIQPPPLSVGPMHLLYPEKKPDVGDFYREVLSDLNVVVESVKETSNRRQMLYSTLLWERLDDISDKVFLTDQYAALCSNPTIPIMSFAREYDWIGSAFFFAKDDVTSPHYRGGNGAVSIRSPKHLRAILHNATKEELEKAGNEDLWYVKRLGIWERSNQTMMMFGSSNNIPPPRLPSFETQTKFGVEVVPSPPDVTPTAIYHIMTIMPFADRERMIRICPEAKRFYPSLHEQTCSVLECPKNMTLNKFQWEKMKKDDPNYDKCTDMCHTVYHPVAAQVAKWANSTSI